MCLSLKLVGNCVKISAFLVLVLGVIGIICASYIGKGDIMVSSVEDTKTTIMVVTIIFSVLLVLIGLAGTIGAWKKSPCGLLIYNIGIGIFFVAFLIISIVAFAVFKKYYASDFNDISVCRNQDWLKSINAVADRGENYLCSSDCACNSHTPFTYFTASNSSTSNSSSNNHSTSSNSSSTNTSSNTNGTSSNSSSNSSSNTSSNSSSNRTYNYSRHGSIRVQDCPNYANDFSEVERGLAATMELLERQFKCAGICHDSQFYAFSDINTGEPSDDCATVLVDIFVSYSKRIGAVTIVMTILLFLTLIASFCLCCHPEKRTEDGGFYKKMGSI